MKRRRFIKNSIAAGLGSILLSPFISDSQKSLAIVKPSYTPEPENWDNDKITLAWVGHSTVLINFYGTWILTDPVLSERIGIYWMGTTGDHQSFHIQRNVEQSQTYICSFPMLIGSYDYPTLKDFAENFRAKLFCYFIFTKDVIEDCREVN